MAPLAAITAMGVHSYFDFNLHIPANALMLVAVMATGYSALHLEKHHGRERMLYKYYDLPLRFKGGFVLLLTFGLILWSGYWAIRHFMAEAYCNTVPNSTLNRDRNSPLEEIDGNRGMLKKITRYIWDFYPDREMVLEAVQERFFGQAEKMLGD